MAHPSLRSPTRYLLLGLFGFVVLTGAGFVVAGAVAVAGGDGDSWLAVAVGLQLTVLGALGCAGMVPTRSPAPPAEQVAGGVALPLRPGHTRRQAAVLVVAGTLPLSLGLAEGGTTLVVAAGVLVLTLGSAGWLLTRVAGHGRVVLDPDGISVPAAPGTRHQLDWRQVEGAEALPRWQPVLVVIPKRGQGEVLGFRLLPQGWSAESLIALIEYYAGHAGRRTDLTSPAGVDRFRG